MKSPFKFCFLTVPLLVLWTAASLWGQGSGLSGAISGYVADPSGAPIAGASITVTNIATGASYHAATTADGFYTVKFLVAGTYRVDASQTGFKTQVVQNVLVQAASNPTVDVKLEVGAVATKVTVTATTSLLEMQRADTGTVVEHKLVDDSPEASSTVTQLYYDSPGVVPLRSSRGFSPGGLNADTQFSINGSGGNFQSAWYGQPNNMLLDGVSTRYTFNGGYFAVNPSVDMTDELKVITNPYSAEYAHTIGGVVIATTKSGTDSWHGRLSEANAAAGLRANTWQNNKATCKDSSGNTYNCPTPRAPGSSNHETGQLGGAIKKGKLFVFGDYEHWYSTASSTSFLGTVPTAAQRQGDFTSTYYNSGTSSAPVASMVTIYDPFTCADTPTGPNSCLAGNPRTQIGPNDTVHPSTTANVIPVSAFSPVAKALFPPGGTEKYIPLPTNLGQAIGSTGKYLINNNLTPAATSSPSWSKYYLGRMDYNLNPSSRLMLRYLHTYSPSTDPPFYGTSPTGLAMQPTDTNFPYIRQGDSGAIEYTHTLSPTSVMSLTLGFYRYSNYGMDAYRRNVTPAQLGFSSTFASQAEPAVPGIFFAGGNYKGGTSFTGVGSQAGGPNPDQTAQLYGLWSKSIGRHTLKVGGETVNERAYNEAGNWTAGSFSFAFEPTQKVWGAAGVAGQGDPIASFFFGVGSYSIDRYTFPARQAWTAGAFIQDDIKVSPRLTINAGLRWDWAGGLTDRYNAISGTFDTAAKSPIASAVQAAAGASSCAACASGLVGGMTFPGVGGNSRSPYDSTFADFAPRFGFAYQLNSKTIIRGGYGLFYVNYQFDPGSTGFSVTTSTSAYDANDAPVILVDNPFPNGLLPQTGSSLGLSTSLGGAVSFTDPHARQPRAQLLNLNIQRLLSPNTVLTVGYVHNGASRLPVSNNINHLTAAQFATCAAEAPGTGCSAAVTNPFKGILPSSGLGGNAGKATISLSSLMLPFPQFTSVTENAMPIGDSSYHALQVNLARHFSHGVSVNVGYTNSKWMNHGYFANAFDPGPQKDMATFDRPQTLVANGVWQVPVGRGQYLGRNMPRWANAILGGWQYNYVFYVWEGIPMYFGITTQPKVGVPGYNSPRSIDQWLNKAAFQTPTNFTDPNFRAQAWSVQNPHVRLPRFHEMDEGLQKNFKIKERVTASIMISFWNSFNSTDWFNGAGAPAATDASKTYFGSITGAGIAPSNAPRAGRIEGRVNF